jgi:Tol biopolymer transport system component
VRELIWRRFVRACLAVLAAFFLGGVLLPASASTGERGVTATDMTSAVVVTDVGSRIVAANTDGSGVHVLSHPDFLKNEYDTNPVPSPDGSLVAFTRQGYVAKDKVMLMHADGSGLRTVAEDTAGGVSWSPDGALLSFKLVDPATSKVNVMLVTRDGSSRRLLFPPSQEGGTEFTWAPDSRSIACTDTEGIDVVDVQTGTAHQLIRMHPDAEHPEWSPDGSRIAFQSKDRVFVMNADGTRALPLGPTTDRAGAISWSPDGTQLAFVSGGTSRPASVVVIDVLTGQTTMRIPSLGRGGSAAPSWSPDGEALAFLRSRDRDDFADIDGDVWVVGKDGTRPVEVTQSFPFGGSQSTPAWLPNASAIAADPALATVSLRPTSTQPLPRRYFVAAVDGTAVAIAADPGPFYASVRGGTLGVWRGSGPVRWITDGSADLVALAGNRVYWSWYGSDHSGSVSELWTAIWPRGHSVRLARVEGKPGGPALMVAGDRSLVVYTYQGALYRLRGADATRVRQEHAKFLEPLSVNRGRVLLYNGRALELVDANGKLLATLPPGKDPVDASLSGDRVILLDRSTIYVHRLAHRVSSTSWPVGAPGRASLVGSGGVPYESLFPYATENPYSDANFRLLDLETGRDAILALPNGTSPITVGISSAGLFFTALPPYSGLRGQVGFVPLAEVRARLVDVNR